MHRHWSQRAFAAVLLAWLVAVATELPLLHSCDVHGSAAAAAADSHGSHHGALHSDAQQSPDADHATCSCLGDCNTGGVSLGLSSSEHRFAVAIARDPGAEPPATGAARIPAAPFVLPYANGPPGTSVLA